MGQMKLSHIDLYGMAMNTSSLLLDGDGNDGNKTAAIGAAAIDDRLRRDL
jgi:hypothetical protein